MVGRRNGLRVGFSHRFRSGRGRQRLHCGHGKEPSAARRSGGVHHHHFRNRIQCSRASGHRIRGNGSMVGRSRPQRQEMEDRSRAQPISGTAAAGRAFCFTRVSINSLRRVQRRCRPGRGRVCESAELRFARRGAQRPCRARRPVGSRSGTSGIGASTHARRAVQCRPAGTGPEPCHRQSSAFAGHRAAQAFRCRTTVPGPSTRSVGRTRAPGPFRRDQAGRSPLLSNKVPLWRAGEATIDSSPGRSVYPLPLAPSASIAARASSSRCTCFERMSHSRLTRLPTRKEDRAVTS